MPLAWAPIKDSWTIDQKRTRKKEAKEHYSKDKKNVTLKKKRKERIKQK